MYMLLKYINKISMRKYVTLFTIFHEMLDYFSLSFHGFSTVLYCMVVYRFVFVKDFPIILLCSFWRKDVLWGSVLIHPSILFQSVFYWCCALWAFQTIWNVELFSYIIYLNSNLAERFSYLYFRSLSWYTKRIKLTWH